MQGVQLDAISINFDQQSTLARLLARENIAVIHGAYKTAWFDPQKRILALPIWKNKGKAVYDLLTGHEVGHALYTPAIGWHEAVDDIAGAPKAYLNVLEDVRIERKVQDRYPGLRSQFQKAYKQLADDDFFGLQQAAFDINLAKAIDKINIKAKLGDHVQVEMDPVERSFYARAFKTETFDEVVALAKELYAYQKSLDKMMPTEELPINIINTLPETDINDMDMDNSNDYEKPDPQEAKEEAEEERELESWMTRRWRPMMAIMYMFCCLADFFIFPIMFTVVQFWETQAANDAFRQWVPITLQGGGLFHVAMGAVLGVSAYGRTQEKLNGAASNTQLPTTGVPTPTLSSATPAIQPAAFGAAAPVTNSFGSQPLGGGIGSIVPAADSWNSPAPATAAVSTGWGGKAAPPPIASWPER